jgi:hypothetical protein
MGVPGTRPKQSVRTVLIACSSAHSWCRFTGLWEQAS